VPVDFSINTEVAIKKALEVVDRQGGVIHLFHVKKNINHNLLSLVWSKPQDIKGYAKILARWKTFLEVADVTVKVTYSIENHFSIQRCIEQKTKQIKADLVVIGKKSNHSLLFFLNTVFPDKLCELTNSAVLTVKPGSLHNKIRTLVVPITTGFPSYKIDAIAALSRKGCLKVFLVTFSNAQYVPAEFSASALLKAYQWLRGSVHCQVEYSVLQGKNKSKALMLFAKKINADVLLLDPSSETKVGWINRHLDNLKAGSNVQVLSVKCPSY
jgi:nucleotide-binding universal stress UspA family protein